MYSLTFWRKFAHFSHFSISTQNHSNLFLAKIRQNTKCIALLFGENSPILATFQSPLKIIQIGFRQNSPKYQVYSVKFLRKFAHFSHFSISTQNHSNWFSAKIRQNTKCIALLFGENSPILATFQSPLKISQIYFWPKFAKIPSV